MARTQKKELPAVEPEEIPAETETATVFDLNALPGKHRNHEIIVGRHGEDVITKTYSLQSNIGVKMPIDHAMKFLQPGFRVVGSDGKDIKPIETKRDGGMGAFELKHNELIVTVDELSDEALYKRCKMAPLSEGITIESSRDEMIAFLIYTAEQARPTGKSRGSDVAEASAGELKSLFGE